MKTKTTSARVRLAVAAVLVGVLGLGPAIAWDMTSQPPRAQPRSAWPRPSPWKAAGTLMKESVRAVAKVYLPPRPDGSSDPSVSVPPTALATPPAASIATAVPTVVSIPHPVVLRGALAIE